MKNFIKILVCSAIFFSSLAFSSECTRNPRIAYNTGKLIDVYLSKNQNTEISFPESEITGLRPEKIEGLVYHYDLKNKRLANKINFSISQEDYQSIVPVHGISGETYLLNVSAKNNCADSYVSIKKQTSETRKSPLTLKTNKKIKKTLMEYLLSENPEDTPPGYSLKKYRKRNETAEDLNGRKVFEMGSIAMYLEYQLIGPKLTGTTLLIENTGRTAFKLDIQSIDYSSKEIIEAFGRVTEITMEPATFVLQQSPEYVEEIYAGGNMGYLHIVSRRD